MEIRYLLLTVCLSKDWRLYNLLISSILRLPRQSFFILCLFNHVTYWVTETNGAWQKFLSLLCGWQSTAEGFWSCSITAGRAGGGMEPWGNSSGADLACGQPQVSPLSWQNDTGTKQFHFPSDNSVLRLDQYSQLFFPVEILQDWSRKQISIILLRYDKYWL